MHRTSSSLARAARAAAQGCSSQLPQWEVLEHLERLLGSHGAHVGHVRALSYHATASIPLANEDEGSEAPEGSGGRSARSDTKGPQSATRPGPLLYKAAAFQNPRQAPRRFPSAAAELDWDPPGNPSSSASENALDWDPPGNPSSNPSGNPSRGHRRPDREDDAPAQRAETRPDITNTISNVSNGGTAMTDAWDNWSEGEEEEMDEVPFLKDVHSLGDFRETVEPVLRRFGIEEISVAFSRFRKLSTFKTKSDSWVRDEQDLFLLLESRLAELMFMEGVRAGPDDVARLLYNYAKLNFRPRADAVLYAMRDDFVATYEEMRAKSMANGLFGLACLDDVTLRMRPTFQVLQACTDFLIYSRGSLTVQQHSCLMYALGKLQYAAKGHVPIPSHEELRILTDSAELKIHHSSMMSLSMLVYGLARLQHRSGFEPGQDIIKAAAEVYQRELPRASLRQIQLVLRGFNMMDVRLEDGLLDALAGHMGKFVGENAARASGVEVSSMLSALAQTHWCPPPGWVEPVVQHVLSLGHVTGEVAGDLLWPAVTWGQTLSSSTVEALASATLASAVASRERLRKLTQERMLWALRELSSQPRGLGPFAQQLKGDLESIIGFSGPTTLGHASPSRPPGGPSRGTSPNAPARRTRSGGNDRRRNPEWQDAEDTAGFHHSNPRAQAAQDGSGFYCSKPRTQDAQDAAGFHGRHGGGGPAQNAGVFDAGRRGVRSSGGTDADAGQRGVHGGGTDADAAQRGGRSGGTDADAAQRGGRSGGTDAAQGGIRSGTGSDAGQRGVRGDGAEGVGQPRSWWAGRDTYGSGGGRDTYVSGGRRDTYVSGGGRDTYVSGEGQPVKGQGRGTALPGGGLSSRLSGRGIIGRGPRVEV